MNPSNSPTPGNRLAAETSPYLLQHADNPVDWYPWGPEALERARAEDKPILLSIGYSACHWCHVMAHESFEDPATARLMNDLFVNIKVDREERPDLDRIYQTAHQMLTQRGGGWPLTMFLSPADHRPFFGGTYFPKEARYGLPAFRDLLPRVAEYYRSNHEDVQRQGEALIEVFDKLLPPPGTGPGTLTRKPLESARELLRRDFDEQFGGFGEAPKFPHPMNLELLLRTWRATAGADSPDLQALYMATLTLTRMAEGGLYDQLGGGFCRYSVDPYWMFPHFETMLYDNGQLLSVYAQAALACGDELFRKVTEETADWLRRDMGHPEGAYYSTLDADSEGHEGRFYVWQAEEVRRLLAPREFEVLAGRFGLDREPNFEGRWHLHAYQPLAEVAQAAGIEPGEADALLESARAKLLAARNNRVWPARDEKILSSWNGLAIAGMAAAARSLGRADAAESAARAADFLHRHCWHQGRLLAVYKDGRSRFPGYLDDYASLGWGLIELAQASWDARWINWAIELAEALLEHFEDRESGGFYFTSDDHEQLIHRPKTFADDATPSGNGMAARFLLRLGHLLGEPRYLDSVERCLRSAWSALEKFPHAHSSLLMALDEFTEPPTIVVIRGPLDDAGAWLEQLNRLYDPRRLVFAIPPDAAELPAALASKRTVEGTVAYICQGTRCSAPVGTLGVLIRDLRGATAVDQ